MTKKRITTRIIKRTDGLSDEEIKKRHETMRRKIDMARKKKEGSGTKKTVDTEKLKTLLDEGVLDAEQLMTGLGGVTRLALKNAVLKVFMEKGKVYEIEGLYGKGARNLKYGKLGIRIPPARLRRALKEGDEFSVKIEGDSIVLSKI